MPFYRLDSKGHQINIKFSHDVKFLLYDKYGMQMVDQCLF